MLGVIHTACEAAGWNLREDSVYVPLPEGRHQILHVRRFEEDGEHLVRVHTAIAPADVLNERRLAAALRLIAGMRYGAFAVLEDELVICDTFTERHTTSEEARRSMAYIASRADDYERSILHVDER